MSPFFPQQDQAAQGVAPMFIASGDGYIRLKFELFQDVKMVHLYSGIDEEKPITTGDGAHLTTITGYTEWVTQGTPALSIGWDWELIGVQGKARLIQTGTLGSNLMFVNQHGLDSGAAQTLILLEGWLDSFPWQTATLNAITAT